MCALFTNSGAAVSTLIRAKSSGSQRRPIFLEDFQARVLEELTVMDVATGSSRHQWLLTWNLS